MRDAYRACCCAQLLACKMGRWWPLSFEPAEVVIAATKMLAVRGDLDDDTWRSVAESIVGLRHRAIVIQRAWRRAAACPTYTVCLRRLYREADDMQRGHSRA